MNHFRCACGNALFFENTACLQCGNAVGYDPSRNSMCVIDKPFLRCRNGTDFGVCNWLVPVGGAELCPACGLNRTIADPSKAENIDAWRKMEAAKRRVLYTLARLDLFPVSKAGEPGGLAFDFLVPTNENRVMTGHEDGVITLNILEGDDLYRERERRALGEPYRTLVGHFRHELGHYYWDRLFRHRGDGDPLLTEFRSLFGDERDDYQAALKSYYAAGPAVGWPSTHITAYATAHPWEDWAETWAQYLHIVDAAETARAFGWASESVPLPFTPFSSSEILSADAAGAEFLETLNGWARIAPALNELAASLGHPSLFPFIFSPPAVRKIIFVHKLVSVRHESQEVASAPESNIGNPTARESSPDSVAS